MATTKRAFSLIEALIVIAIIGLLLSVLVPTFERSLGRNKLANDVTIIKEKLSETRTLAGSTQDDNETVNTDPQIRDQVGYYALFIPGDARGNDYAAIVRISDPISLPASLPNYCSAETAALHADPKANLASADRYCLIERISLSSGVQLLNTNRPDRLVAFKVPSRQVVELGRSGASWIVSPEPLFDWSSGPMKLTFSDKTATVSLEPYTAELKVSY